MGVLGIFKESITLINRVPWVLSVRYDGEDTVLQPGENNGFPLVAVPFAKRQNILMGSRHPLNPSQAVYLVGIKDVDDCSPIEPELLEKAEKALEAVDRDGSFWGEPMERQIGAEIKIGRAKKAYSNFEAQTSMPSSYDVNRNID
jgi:hypothetical protein